MTNAEKNRTLDRKLVSKRNFWQTVSLLGYFAILFAAEIAALTPDFSLIAVTFHAPPPTAYEVSGTLLRAAGIAPKPRTSL
jgi:hypothetical protein